MEFIVLLVFGAGYSIVFQVFSIDLNVWWKRKEKKRKLIHTLLMTFFADSSPKNSTAIGSYTSGSCTAFFSTQKA